MEYHKIDTIFARDGRGRIIEGTYARPEFAYLADLEWVFTEKVDGTSIRLSYDGTPYYRTDTPIPSCIRGRTDNAQIPPHLLGTLIELMRGMDLGVVFGTDPTDVTLYGEGYGAKIQKGGGKYIPDGCSFVLFDVKVGSWWLTRDAVAEIGQQLGIDVVPVVGTGTLADAVELTRKGFPSVKWPGVDLAEGLVLRPAVELFDRGGRRIITKIKYRDFR